MKKRTDQLGADMLRGSYTKWLDQTLELVKPPTPPHQESAPKLQPPKIETPKPAQPTPTQINRQDTAKPQPQTGRKWSEITLPASAGQPQKMWKEVKLPAPASTYLTGRTPAAPDLPYAAGQQAEAGRKAEGSALNDFESGRHSEMK